MTVRSDTVSAEQSSEAGRERHVLIPWARLADTTPTLKDPACVTGLIAGAQMCGTVINAGTAVTDTYAILNVAEGAIYRHNVRSVLTYDGANNEATWGAMNVGDPVFYDPTADANTAGVCKLSTSPLQGDASTVNPRFGTIVMMQDEDADSFAKGSASPGVSAVCAICQCGMNHV